MGKHPQRLFGFQEKENSKEKRKTRELCISLSVKHNIYVRFFSRGDFHPLYSLYKSKSFWLVSYKDKKGNYIKKIHRKRSKVESAKTEENSHHAWAVRIWKVLCEFRTTWRCCANFAQAWSSCLPKAISSSFQLQIVHGLKRWILDFLSFEMVYSM